MIEFVYANTGNLGDEVSSPRHWFDWTLIEGDAVVYGGGLLSSFMRPNPEDGRPTVGWGVGCSLDGEFGPHPPGHFADQAGWYDLSGIRDQTLAADHDRHHVPCASCMSSVFETTQRAWRPVVFYSSRIQHYQKACQPVRTNEWPNEDGVRRMEDVVRFLATGEIVVTNSYHGAYWAQLLGRKLIVTPHGSKYYHLPRKAMYRAFDDWIAGLQYVRPADAVLEECREANVDYWRRVREFLA